jgi:hypothetical protein
MHISRVRNPLVILGLAAAFYVLGTISIDRMPFTSLPSWWMGIWPSRRVGIYTWFGLLNAAGAVIAAVPVAILLRGLIDLNRVRAAFIVGVLPALIVIGSVIMEYPPSRFATALMAVELFLVIFLAVPFLIWLMRALPSIRFERSRASSSVGQGGDR